MLKSLLFVPLFFSLNASAFPIPTSFSVDVVGLKTVKQLPVAKDMSISKEFNLASGRTLTLNCLIGEYAPYGELVINDSKEPVTLPYFNYKECLKLMTRLEQATERSPVMVNIQDHRLSVNVKF